MSRGSTKSTLAEPPFFIARRAGPFLDRPGGPCQEFDRERSGSFSRLESEFLESPLDGGLGLFEDDVSLLGSLLEELTCPLLFTRRIPLDRELDPARGDFDPSRPSESIFGLLPSRDRLLLLRLPARLPD